jgi:hypothetical protein
MLPFWKKSEKKEISGQELLGMFQGLKLRLAV